MKYFAYTHSKDEKSVRLQRIFEGKPYDQTVYVIGVEDHIALQLILAGGELSPSDTDDMRDIATIAKTVKHVEAIGRPDGRITEAQLIALANQRIMQLEAA